MTEQAKPLRVLIVEDTADDAELILRALRAGGYEPGWRRVESSNEYEAALQAESWDVILSDYKLPMFNGREALRRLQALKRYIPFIIVSGTIGEEVAVEAMRAGAQDYVMKDRLQRLVPAIERLLDETRLRRNMTMTERALDESREFLARIINAVADPIFVKDREHRWVLVNDAFCQFVGHTRETLLGKSDYDCFPHQQAHVFWEKAEKVVRDGKTDINEELITGAAGRTHTIVTKKTLYTNDEGQSFIVGVIRDVTEIKEGEQKLRETMKDVATFNKLMLGREERVLELKKEVNDALALAGRPPKYTITAE